MSPSRALPLTHPIIVIVGRTNVGKSTLYNRLTGTRRSIVSAIPATTRDILYEQTQWRGMTATVIDTGGLSHAPSQQSHYRKVRQQEERNDPFLASVREKVGGALEQADQICLVVDVTTGVTRDDTEWARFLKTLHKPITVAVNKADRPALRQEAHTFTQLGFEHVFPVSASNGGGVGDLLDHLMESAITEIQDSPALPSIVLMGKPNVGKSTLYNALVGVPEAITSPLPHTTREPRRRSIKLQDFEVDIFDTVGVRRQSKRDGRLEKAGVEKTLGTMMRSQIAVFIVDPFQEGISNQDQDLARLIVEKRLAVIIAVNKIDAKGERATEQSVTKAIRSYFPHLFFAPVMLISAEHGTGIDPLVRMIPAAALNYRRVFEPDMLATLLSDVVLFPSATHKKNPAQLTLKQISSQPPEFLLPRLKKQKTPIAVINIIERRLREALPLEGTPIMIHVERPVGTHRHHLPHLTGGAPLEEPKRRKRKPLRHQNRRIS